MSLPKFPKNTSPLVVNSHPRSGTHLLIDLLRRQYKECAIKKTWDRGLDDLYFSIEGLLDAKADIDKIEKKGLRVLASCEAPLVKYHCYSEGLLKIKFPDWMHYLSKCKSIYIYRNLYDVLCSTYIYMQSFENAGKGVSLSAFIRQPFANSPNRVHFWLNEVQHQRSRTSNLMLSYEDIIDNTESVLDQLDVFLSLKSIRYVPLLPPKTYNKWKIRWQRLFSSYPNNTAILASHNGITKLNSDTAFSKQDLNFINDMAGSTLTDLGYPIKNK
ncbi:sulfotransferase domain-containing protein [Winogradskyella aurantia]|uniref:Sulfotransferase domain-containing protein n=1 Tax=Winogradskyella aurantia TaxID=1915063 RepID=A0A265UVJ7_9FLAO|nr:sulfotransferase domain-containing protein [Winogradskyella aurantia]OZV69232.1 hypothetical protein CA834_07185 [Winogradskyella aurantia]